MRRMLTVTGIVLKGERRGIKIGFPTANIEFHDPAFAGIYAGRATLSGVTYGAAVYIDPARELLEAHLLNFQGDLYDKELTIEVIAKIRDSATFSSDTELQAAIAGDIVAVREYLASIH